MLLHRENVVNWGGNWKYFGTQKEKKSLMFDLKKISREIELNVKKI